MRLKKVLIGILAAVILFFLAKGMIARVAVSACVQAVTGLHLEIRRMEVGVFRSRVHVQGMKLHNPGGFPDRIMADVPEIYVDYDLPAFLTGRTHLREARLNLQEFVVVKDRQGRLNLDSLSPVKKAKEEKDKPASQKKPAARPGSFQIDDLELKVGNVVYKDYSGGGEPSVREFPVNLDEHHHNVNDPGALGALIVSRALLRTTIASLTNFDLGSLDNYARDILRFSTGTVSNVGGKAVDAAGNAVQETADTLKKLIPFGGEEQKKQQ